eukprot:3216793-Rhodomonas_salina.3
MSWSVLSVSCATSSASDVLGEDADGVAGAGAAKGSPRPSALSSSALKSSSNGPNLLPSSPLPLISSRCAHSRMQRAELRGSGLAPVVLGAWLGCRTCAGVTCQRVLASRANECWRHVPTSARACEQPADASVRTCGAATPEGAGRGHAAGGGDRGVRAGVAAHHEQAPPRRPRQRAPPRRGPPRGARRRPRPRQRAHQPCIFQAAGRRRPQAGRHALRARHPHVRQGRAHRPRRSRSPSEPSFNTLVPLRDAESAVADDETLRGAVCHYMVSTEACDRAVAAVREMLPAINS